MNTKAASIAERLKILALVLIVASMFLGFSLISAKDVILSVDGVEKEITTFANTVEDLIQSEGVKIEKGSYVNFPLNKELKDQDKIIVQSIQKFKVKDSGEFLEISSTSNLVKDVLDQGGITLGEHDYTYPELDREVKANSRIRIYRITENIETNETSIPFKKEVKENPEMEKGKEKLVQEGKEGIKKTDIITKYLNGVEASTNTVSSVVLEPVNQVVEVGTKEPKPEINVDSGNASGNSSGNASGNTGGSGQASGSTNINYKKELIMQATAYDDSYESQGAWVGQTATGMKPQRGVVAVDPRVIPLGTKLYIASTDGSADYGFAIAGDTGGAIKGNRIDLFHNTREECRAFGRRNVKVYILN